MKKITVLMNGILLALVLGLSACDGDQGEVGPTGLQGEKGDKGDQGVAGIEEAASFGNIEITVTGTRPDGEAYTQMLDFLYLPENDGIYGSSFYEWDGGIDFNITRSFKTQFSNAGRSDEDNTISISFGVEEGVIVYPQIAYNATIIDELKTFRIWHEIYSEDQDIEITNYSFNKETGKLTFNFSFSYVDYDDNEVTISGVVDVFVVENIQPA